MKNHLANNDVLQTHNNSWYTENFISNSIIKYLLDNGYRIHKEEGVKKSMYGERVIITSKYFTKEIIEVKGLVAESNRSKLLMETADKINPTRSFKNFLSDTLFNSLVNFGKYYSDGNAEVAIGLPIVDRYKTIIEMVQEYFITNRLSLKLYLVNQDGSVEVSNLNENL